MSVITFFFFLFFATRGLCAVTGDDLRGTLSVFKGLRVVFPFCAGPLLLAANSSTVTRFEVNLDGINDSLSAPCAPSLPAEMRLLNTAYPAYGRTQYRNRAYFTCGASANISASIFRMTRDAIMKLPDKSRVRLAAGNLYWYINDGYHSCIWWRADNSGSGPANNGTTTKPANNGSQNNINDNNDNGQGIWFWLGPVLGAGATIIAAVLTVYLSQEYWLNRLRHQTPNHHTDMRMQPAKPEQLYKLNGRPRISDTGVLPDQSFALDGTPR